MYTFYALLNRMKLIERWSLMRSTTKEDLMQHAAHVAIIGQALGIIRNEYFGGNVDTDKIAALALYHDTAEVGCPPKWRRNIPSICNPTKVPWSTRL